ncbi:ABC1 kinase family protein [Streptomyces yerevanensis]|uniref:ABC1 kinase family protein n=1 Tax=Streptomyces yerevanensis TaxID=66378 RepID=UPI001FE1D542|nr:AarF/UbiB family protein [Streptomyces yerevanensis]
MARTLGDLIGREAAHTFRPRRHPVGDRPDVGERRARSVRQALESLGPFYIKVGQMLATRPDFVPPAMISEFEKLHDQVSPTPFATFEPVLVEELGPGWRQRFRDIDTTQPLGTASLAQVYRGVLPDGEQVAVKIQRPGVRDVMAEDMALLHRVSRFTAKRMPRFNDVIDIEAMLAVVFDAMRPELDFVLEARNMERAREVAREFEHIAVPRVVDATPRVLVQSLAPGCPIREADRDAFSVRERQDIGRDLLAFMYRGYFIDRVFHADPHPGNIFVHPGEKATIIDWGMVGRIDRPMSNSILLLMLNLAMNDGAGTARAWIDMGSCTAWTQAAAFADDMAALVPKIATASLEELDFGVTLTAVLQHSTRRGIRTSPMVSILGKSFANIEGSIRHLCPELSLVDVFSEELSGIVTGLLRESFSAEQVMRTALEVVAGGASASQQLRGLTRDLTNRDLAMRVSMDEGAPAGGRTGFHLGPKEMALALGALALGSRRRNPG